MHENSKKGLYTKTLKNTWQKQTKTLFFRQWYTCWPSVLILPRPLTSMSTGHRFTPQAGRGSWRRTLFIRRVPPYANLFRPFGAFVWQIIRVNLYIVTFFYSTNIFKYSSNILFDNLTNYYFTITKNQITFWLLKAYTKYAFGWSMVRRGECVMWGS